MRCEDIMKRTVVCCKETDTIQSAALKMRDANIGFLPVCGLQGKTLGVITDRDMALRACAAGLDPKKSPVTEIMTHQIISCQAADDVRYVEGLMARNRKSRIIVQDEAGHPLGVISLSDIARHDRVFAAETMRQVSAREILTA
jgi:predicted transcriptional regulator